jgi:hypothetical protein
LTACWSRRSTGNVSFFKEIFDTSRKSKKEYFLPLWPHNKIVDSNKKTGNYDIMANEHRLLRDPNFPFPMSFPTRILLYIALDLTIINLIVFYWHENLSLSLVVPVIIIEILVLAISMAFWVSPYKLKW